MGEDHAAVPTKIFGVVLAAACAVVVWKVVALVLLSSQAETSHESLAIKTLLALAGITFLVCGLLTFRKMPGKATLLFAAFCICSGLHWGGPLELPQGHLRTALLFFYLVVSSFLGETFLLHFALSFPKESRLVRKKTFIRTLYAPAVLATVLAAVYLISPAESSLQATSEGLFLALHMVVSNLFGALALVLYVTYIVRAGLTTTQKRYVSLMVGGMLTAWLPYVVASAVGVETDPWNLTVVALPISFTIAIFGIGKARLAAIPALFPQPD